MAQLIHDTIIGNLLITGNGNAVTGIWPYKSGIINEASDRITEQAARELDEYFAGKRRIFTVPTFAEGTAFQRSVWAALSLIPYGETRSYGQIAESIGNPKACRAVGNANNRNPIMIIIPCHRVIGADNTLVGYGGGLDVKRKLLELEKNYFI